MMSSAGRPVWLLAVLGACLAGEVTVQLESGKDKSHASNALLISGKWPPKYASPLSQPHARAHTHRWRSLWRIFSARDGNGWVGVIV